MVSAVYISITLIINWHCALLIYFVHLSTLSKFLTVVYSFVCSVILLQTIVYLYSARIISTSAERKLLWLSSWTITIKQYFDVYRYSSLTTPLPAVRPTIAGGLD